MPKIADLTGQRFGRLLVKSYSHKSESGWVHYWNCDCDCGNAKKVNRASLKNGRTKSCGCLEEESRKTNSFVHGLTNDPLWRRWTAMIHRCEYPATVGFEHYGGKGIAVSPDWHTFENFKRDMGESFKEELTLGRLDSSKDYSKENCRWETWEEQGNNRSTNRRFTLNGITKTMTQWAKHFKIPFTTIRYQLVVKNVPIEQAVKTQSWGVNEPKIVSRRQSIW